MDPIIINDIYVGKDKIKDVKDITIQIKDNSKIVINGKIAYENCEKDFSKEILFDKEWKINNPYIEDFSYELLDNQIRFKVTLSDKIDSNKIEQTKKETFEEELNKLLSTNNLDIISTVESNSIPFREEIISIEEEEIPLQNESNEKDIKEKDNKEIQNNEIKSNSLFTDQYVSSYTFYRVKENDTLESISKRYNINIAVLEKINGIGEIKVNDLIQIPR